MGYYFLAKNFKGELKLGGPEAEKQSKDNIYLFEWFPIADLDKILFYPKDIGKKIKAKFLPQPHRTSLPDSSWLC